MEKGFEKIGILWQRWQGLMNAAGWVDEGWVEVWIGGRNEYKGGEGGKKLGILWWWEFDGAVWVGGWWVVGGGLMKPGGWVVESWLGLI